MGKVINLNRNLTPVEKNLLKIKKIDETGDQFKKVMEKKEIKKRVQEIMQKIDDVLQTILKEYKEG